MYILKFTIKPKDVFESSMNLQNYSLMGIFNLVFTVIAIVLTIYLMITNIFSIFICLLLTVLRKIGLKYGAEFLYKFSNWIAENI